MTNSTPQPPSLTASEQSATRIAIAYALIPESRLKLSSVEGLLFGAAWLDD